MDDLAKKLEKISQRFGIVITPDNVDRIQKETWDKYYRIAGRNRP